MLFSIIIPLYNKAPYVGRALASVLGQDFADYELIVVDDGSTDGSMAVVENLVEADARLAHLRKVKRLTLLSQANAGVSTARNVGVARASGDFLCFLDADDAWTPVFLSEMAACIATYPQADLYACNYYYVKNGGSRICVKEMDSGYLSYFETYNRQLQLGGGMPVWTGAMALRREVFVRLGGFKPPLHLGEDFDLWVRVALQGPLAFWNKPLAYYHQDVGPRAVGRLHAPEHHFLWNLGHLAEEEARNPACKRLLDRLRATGLLPYYLQAPTRPAARTELAKVDWTSLPAALHRPYFRPLWCTKLLRHLRRRASQAKQTLLRRLRRVDPNA